MVGSAVETEASSRAERERQIHIETKISQNLGLFLDGTVSSWTALSPFFDIRVAVEPVEVEWGMKRRSTESPSDGNMVVQQRTVQAP